jgi:hypothetical protein
MYPILFQWISCSDSRFSHTTNESVKNENPLWRGRSDSPSSFNWN